MALRSGQKPGDNREACENLNQIRNALAHGSPPNSWKVKNILKDEQELRETLQDAFDCLYRAKTKGLSFNRTSLESKLIFLYQSVRVDIELLIEPVWNRNCFGTPTLASSFSF